MILKLLAKKYQMITSPYTEEVELALVGLLNDGTPFLAVDCVRLVGVDVIEAPYDAITYRLIDRYLEIKRAEAIG